MKLDIVMFCKESVIYWLVFCDIVITVERNKRQFKLALRHFKYQNIITKNINLQLLLEDFLL